ncbi:DHS-like NAD/FAD-binding domain-containing protein [Tuber indicum]|nr:DHS-like NAD/FAD-binding domain-containing protein [Tuber indicum]
MALCGAGLSAASGLPTFHRAGGMWWNYEVTLLAIPEAFEAGTGLVWQFYNMRRHMALTVKPNAAHFVLTELVKGGDGGFRTLTQSVGCLSPRANHPPETIDHPYGHLLDAKCFRNNLLRLGVVWFGEMLDEDMLVSIDRWIDGGVDLCIVLGRGEILLQLLSNLSRPYFPPIETTNGDYGSYAHTIRQCGGKAAVVDLDVSAGSIISNYRHTLVLLSNRGCDGNGKADHGGKTKTRPFGGEWRV